MSAPLITSHQLAYARQTAERSMTDTCVRLAYSELRNSDDQEIGAGFTPAETFVCGFQRAGTREAGTGVVTDQDRVRLPLSADGVFSSQDRVRITHRFGVALVVPIERAIDGDPAAGTTAILIDLTDVHSAPEAP